MEAITIGLMTDIPFHIFFINKTEINKEKSKFEHKNKSSSLYKLQLLPIIKTSNANIYINNIIIDPSFIYLPLKISNFVSQIIETNNHMYIYIQNQRRKAVEFSYWTVTNLFDKHF